MPRILAIEGESVTVAAPEGHELGGELVVTFYSPEGLTLELVRPKRRAKLTMIGMQPFEATLSADW